MFLLSQLPLLPLYFTITIILLPLLLLLLLFTVYLPFYRHDMYTLLREKSKKKRKKRDRTSRKFDKKETDRKYGTFCTFFRRWWFYLAVFYSFQSSHVLFCIALPTAAAFYHSATGNFLTGADRPRLKIYFVFSPSKIHVRSKVANAGNSMGPWVHLITGGERSLPPTCDRESIL